MKILAWLCIGMVFLTSCKRSETQNAGTGLVNYTKKENVVYATSENSQGVQQDLQLDAYLPDNAPPANPLVVLIHGGTFASGNKSDLGAFCAYLAERGFTAVTMEYRLGWNTGTESNFCSGDPYSLLLAGYRAIQDCRAAIRYLLAHKEQYKIDPRNIFIGGQSAGAVMALSTAFSDQEEMDLIFPQAKAQLGGLDESGNTYAADFSIKGVVNMWGGILNPAVITAAEQIPVLGFHGQKDPVIPFGEGHFADCENYPLLFGSKVIYDMLSARNVSAVLHTQPNGMHGGVYDFNYLAQNTYCFLESQVRNEKVSGSYTNYRSNCQ